jgi:hypothetical protein
MLLSLPIHLGRLLLFINPLSSMEKRANLATQPHQLAIKLLPNLDKPISPNLWAASRKT